MGFPLGVMKGIGINIDDHVTVRVLITIGWFKRVNFIEMNYDSIKLL